MKCYAQSQGYILVEARPPVLDSKRGPHVRLANLMRACGPLFVLSLVRSSLNLKHGS